MREAGDLIMCEKEKYDQDIVLISKALEKNLFFS